MTNQRHRARGAAALLCGLLAAFSLISCEKSPSIPQLSDEELLKVYHVYEARLEGSRDDLQLTFTRTPEIPEFTEENEGGAYWEQAGNLLHVTALTGIGQPKPDEAEDPIGSLAGASVSYTFSLESGEISQLQFKAAPNGVDRLSISKERLAEIARLLFGRLETVWRLQSEAETATSTLQSLPTLENIVPVLDELPEAVLKGGAYPELPALDYASLLYYWVDRKRGVADWEGNILIDAAYDVAWCSAHGFCDQKYGLMFDSGFVPVLHGGHGGDGWWYYDPDQALLFASREGPFSPVDESGLSGLREAGLLPGLFECGTYTVPDPAYPDEGGCDPWGSYILLDASGKPLTEPVLEGGTSFREGSSAVKQEGKWRFLNETGAPLFSRQFDHAYGFYEGAAAVSLKGKWGYINPDGTDRTGLIYEEARTSFQGRAWVKESGRWHLMELPPAS